MGCGVWMMRYEIWGVGWGMCGEACKVSCVR